MRMLPLQGSLLLLGLFSQSLYAAALDRSGQSISGFLQPNNYIDIGTSYVDADVTGKVRNGWNVPLSDGNKVGSDLAGTGLSNVAQDFFMSQFNLKLQLSEKFSFGLIYDQPFGAKASYSAQDSNHTQAPKYIAGIDLPVLSKPVTNLAQKITGSYDDLKNFGAFHNGDEATTAKVATKNATMLFGFQPTENWNFYAGPVYQTVKGSVQLRGSVYGPLGGVLCSDNNRNLLGVVDLNINACSGFNDKDTKAPYKGYNADIPEKGAFGWIAGLAYQIPEIALRASLTYRSEIDYDVQVRESMPEVADSNAKLIGGMIKDGIVEKVPAFGKDYKYAEGKTSVTTPQSVNLDIQSGIMKDTLAFLNLRWVDWSNFAIRPYQFGQLSAALTESQGRGTRGFDLVAYDEDQYSVTFGVARKFNEKIALTILGGYDTGAGDPVSTLGPTHGYWSAGFGGQYSFTPSTFVQAGARYFWFGDAKAQSASWFGTERYDADFTNNDGIGMSVKLAHRF